MRHAVSQYPCIAVRVPLNGLELSASGSAAFPLDPESAVFALAPQCKLTLGRSSISEQKLLFPQFCCFSSTFSVLGSISRTGLMQPGPSAIKVGYDIDFFARLDVCTAVASDFFRSSKKKESFFHSEKLSRGL